MKLREIINIYDTRHVSNRDTEVSAELIATVRSKHIKNNNVNFEESLEDKEGLRGVSASDINDLLIRKNDIIIISKGPLKIGFVHNDPGKMKLIPFMNMLLLRVNNAHFDPRFVNWYLQTNQIVEKISSTSKRSIIPFIHKKTLSELEIPEVPLDVQQQIIEMDTLFKAEKEKTLLLLEKKEKYYESKFLELLGGNHE